MKKNYLEIFDSFIDDVLADKGNKIYPKTITKLVENVAEDLESSKKYYFDEDEVEKVLKVMSTFPMTKGSYTQMNFGPIMATACETTIVEARQLLEQPMPHNHIQLPSVYVDHLIKSEEINHES